MAHGPSDLAPVRPGLRLALNLASWSTTSAAEQLSLVSAAEALGYDAVWIAEAYGSDAVTPLAWLAGHTTRIGLGSGVMQVPARSAAMTAMTAATIDSLSDGRFRLGLGVSGPQVSEGWHGVMFGHPLARLREYVEAVRQALARAPLSYAGEHVRIPPPGSDARAMSLAMRPVREHVPVYLAAVGPRALDLCAEIGDGWLSSFADTTTVAEAVARFDAGRAHRLPGIAAAVDDVVVGCPLVATDGTDSADDIAAAADPVRDYAALYVGGMGGRQDNVYAKIAARLGYATAAATVQDLYLTRRRAEAAAALPSEFIDRVSLLGPPQRIAQRLAELSAAGATTVSVMPFAPTVAARVAMLEAAAEALRTSGVGA